MGSKANSGAFLSVFRETLGSHFAGLGGIVAGLIVAWRLGVFRNALAFPWVFAIYPAVLTAEIVLNGIFSGRLNTALDVGTISPRFDGNMRKLGLLLHRVLTLTLATSVMMAIVSAVLVSLIWGLPLGFINFLGILVVTVATMSLGLMHYLFVLPITFAVFKRGVDLDSVAYPIVGTIADVFITVCYALTIGLFLNFGSIGKYVVMVIAVLAVLLMLVFLPLSVGEEGFSKSVRNSILGLLLMAVIASFAGTVLQEINVGVNAWNKNGAFYPLTLFVAYPAVIELIGDAALVIGSTATTRLVLGLLEPHFSAMKNHARQILGAWASSAVAFVPFSAVSLLVAGTFGLPAFYLLTSVLLLTNVFAVFAMTLISYAFAILTFKKGLDPDHFVNPLIISLAGTLATVALLAATFLLLGLRG
jgi:cation transporter-like permease